MKYSQFDEFEKLLESNNLSIDQWKKNPNITLLKEESEEDSSAEDKLDTKKGNILTKRGRQRMALNKYAKKLQEQINKDIADKFLKPIFDLKVHVYKKMAELGRGKQPKEIISALQGDLKNIQKTQAKQLSLIEKSAQTSINQMTEKIEATIEKKDLKDNTKANLKTYWNLLTTQIMMNLLQKLAKKDDELIGQTIKDQEIIKAARDINKALNKGLAQKTGEIEGQVKQRKEQIKAEDEKASEGEEKSVKEPKEKSPKKSEEKSGEESKKE